MELLAPSDKKTFFEAINNGADAVYIGLNEFSARRNADNIALEELDYYISYAHTFGVKVYCAVNTIIKDQELSNFFNLILSAYSKGVDAFIMQDVFLGKFLKEKYPEITLHLSTQAGVNNLYSARVAKEFGFSRVVLAREAALEEVSQICKEIETEIFVQGALCSSFSGHCYYSSYIGGNSGNRGRCKQPCRQKFNYIDKKTGGEYSLSLSDLQLVDYIDIIKRIGVSSVKIEGRMRSSEYVAKAVSLYRKAIDGLDFSREKSELSVIYNRGDYTSGYFVKDKNIISDKIQSHKGKFYCKIKKIDDNFVICDKKANEGDCFKIIREGFEVGNATFIDGKYLFKGNPVINDTLFITKDLNLINSTINIKRFKDLDLSVSVENKKLVVYCKQNQKKYLSEDIVQKAINTPTSLEQIIECFNKTDLYPFKVNLKFDLFLEKIFIPKSQLNAFRRSVFYDIFYSCQNVKNIKNTYYINDFKINYICNSKRAVIISNTKQLLIDADIFIIFPKDYSLLNQIVTNENFINCKKEKFLFIPSFLNNKDLFIEDYIKYFDGVYADGLIGIYLANEHHKNLFIGLGLNVFNGLTYSIIKNLYPNAYICVSKELDKQITYGDGFVFDSGAISIMEFIYCPFKNDCKNCSKKDFYSAKDGWEEFILRRFSLSSCRFMLYPQNLFKFKLNCNTISNLLLEESVQTKYKPNLKNSFYKGVE